MFYKNRSADLVTLFSQADYPPNAQVDNEQVLNGRKTQSFAFQPSVTATTRQRHGNDTCLHREKTVTK
ncbi:MAG: hypothetical protein ACI30J_02160 [Paludibacteraceae bacterium]